MNVSRLVFALGAVGMLCVAQALEIVAPTDGETLRQHFPAQAEYLTKPLAERERYFDGGDNARAMARDGSCPMPIAVRWKDAAGSVHVTVRRLPDGKVFFAETVSATNCVAVDSLEIARNWELAVADGRSSACVRFRTEDLAPRLVRIEGVPNARDIGGWIGLGGRRVRQGVLFRTSGLNDNPPRRYLPGQEVMRLDAEGKLSSMEKDGYRLHVRIAHGEDFSTNESVRVGYLEKKGADRLQEQERIRIVEAFGLKVDLDLRRDAECAGMTGSPLGNDVSWKHVSYLPYDLDSAESMEINRRVFRVIFDARNHPVVFHCIGGADRTGTVACIVEALLGVGEDDIWKDYLATGFWGEVSNRKHHDMFAHLVHQLRQRYGNALDECARSYFQELGFSAAEIEAFRERMLEPADPSDTDIVVDGSSLRHVDPFIGTEGLGSGYGGIQPCTTVPFGSMHIVPMTRINRIGALSFNSLDDTLIGFILTRQPAIWMGDWGEVRIPIAPAKIEKIASAPHLTRVRAGGRDWEMTATAHAAWIRGGYLDVVNGCCRDRMDEHLGRPLPGFAGWRYVEHDEDGRGVRIGVSLISLEDAKANLAREIGSRSFAEVRDGTRREWLRYFDRVQIDAEPDRCRIFYTALFHSLLYPRQIDENGRYYSAFDDKIHDGTMYSCYSLWDTYRAEHPLLTLVAPERVDGMMQSLLEMYREGGWLPKWPNPGYTGIMVGAPAEVVLADAVVKGFCGFDWNLAYEAVKKNATVPQARDEELTWEDRGMFGTTPETRGGLTSYMTHGYVACDRTAESVSRTQDFGLGDCAAAVIAEATGHADMAGVFRTRSKNYTNLWNATAGQILPRKADGSFASGDWKIKGTIRGYLCKAYCEQSPETATWAIPYDTAGLAALLGGNCAAVRKLDDFFDNLFFKPDGRGNKSVHGNEPSHHCAYLYNRWGAPEKTQRRVREILAQCYSTNRKGFDGNEDCGQMSAWYIFSSLGLYPLDPTSGEYEIGSPAVRGAKLSFGAPYTPATLDIKTMNYHPDRWRVKRVTLNGVELKDWRVRHEDLVKGGELVFEMM